MNSTFSYFDFNFSSVLLASTLLLFLMAVVVHHEKDVDSQIGIVKSQRLDDGAGLADVQTTAAGRFDEKGV